MTRIRHAPLPQPPGPDRRVGVEIELGGLDEGAIAGTVMHVLGGQRRTCGETRLQVCGTRIGTLRIELDTAYATRLAQGPSAMLAIARHVVPSEIVTDPIPEGALPLLDGLVRELRHAGAEGSGASAAKGFGVHFNPEIADPDPGAILRVLQAYALMEPWLRAVEPMTLARRLLPFTEPWPPSLSHALVARDPAQAALPDLIDLYLAEAPSRNFGLDLLPLWRHLDAARVTDVLGDAAPAARPTYHFRLPTCRIDEPRWRVTDEWAKWQAVERLAEDGPRLSRLRDDWLGAPPARGGHDDDWIDRVGALLR